MKKLVKIILCLTVLVLCLASCGPKELPIPGEQQILFEVSHINFAWGKQHNGFLIDRDGNIWVYKNPDSWKFPSADNQILAETISANLTKATQSPVKIPAGELKKQMNKIYTIDPTHLTPRVNTGADAGSYSSSMYLYNSKAGIYTEVTLSQSGDWSFENKDKAAKEIREWLSEVSNRLR